MAQVRQLDEILLEEHLVDDLKLEEARAESQKTGEALTETVIRMGIVPEETLYRLIALYNDREFIEIADAVFDLPTVALLSKKAVAFYKCIPYLRDGQNMTLITPDPSNPQLIELERELTHQKGILNFQYLVATPSGVQGIIQKVTSGTLMAPPPPKKDEKPAEDAITASDIEMLMEDKKPAAKKLFALGQQLIEEGIITEEQLDMALEEQRKTGGLLGNCLIKLNFLTEETLYSFLALQHNVGYTDLKEIEIPAEIIDEVPKKTAQKHNVLPLERTPEGWTFCTSDWNDSLLQDFEQQWIQTHGFQPVTYKMTAPSALKAALEKYYGAMDTPAPRKQEVKEIDQIELKAEPEENAEDIIAKMSQEDHSVQTVEGNQPPPAVETEAKTAVAQQTLEERMQKIIEEGQDELKVVREDGTTEDGEDIVIDTPVINLCNAIISNAVAKRASDIHLNFFERSVVMRYRVDGVLQTQPPIPQKYRRAVVNRYKNMSGMDIMERRKAQDGRIKIKVQNKLIDLRVSCLPSIYGENIVMRILDRGSLQLDMSKLGFEPQELDIYLNAIRKPYGMILMTGPTGSGKTTTLYSALSTLNNPSVNIMTIEDPVEYQLGGVIQVQINHEIGFDFANALRSILRQDPNIMMVGEMRDSETAEIAFKAALTGHLVFSTVHTNDAPSTIPRLIDMGVDPIYVGSSLLLVVAQRLMRTICPQCKEEYVPNEDDMGRVGLKMSDIEGLKVYRGKGCHNCNGTGYRGRVALYEIMQVTPEISDLIFARADLNALRAKSIEQGLNTLREVAVVKWKNGISTLDEIIRVTTEGD